MVQPISKLSRVSRRQIKLSFAIHIDIKQIWGKGYLIHSGRNKKRQHCKAIPLQAWTGL
jgi:hypothetical protein